MSDRSETHLDLQTERGSRFARVSWTLSYIGLLGYTFAIITYVLPIGEASMILALAGLLLDGKRVRLPRFLILFGLFLLWAAIGITVSVNPSSVGQSVIDAGKLWLIALVIVNALRTPAQLRGYLIFLLACFAMYPARGAIFNYIGGYTLVGRALWNNIFANPNDLAALTFLPLSIAVGLLYTERRGLFRWGAAASIVVLPLVILTTQSRGAFIALAIVGGYSLLRQRKNARAVFVAAVLVILALAVVPNGAWDRFAGLTALTSTETIAEADPEGSAEARFHIWKVAARIIGDRPATGVGLGAYDLAHAVYAPLVPGAPQGLKDTHSTYLWVAATTGIPGLLLFLGILLAVWVRAEKVRRAVGEAAPRHVMTLRYLQLGLVAYLLAGLFGSYAILSFLYLHISLIWVAAEILERQRRSHSRRSRAQRPNDGAAVPDLHQTAPGAV